MAEITAEQVKALKGQGLLRNRGTDLFSARIVTVNGRLSAEKCQAIVDAAERYGEGIVSFTTRQTIEVPGIPFDSIEEFRAAIGKAGLSTGGTGAKVRPVTSCKGTICQYGNIDTFAFSERIHHQFYEGYRPYALPHKFKIAVGGCPNNCVKPDLNDIGVVGVKKPIVDAGQCIHCGVCEVMEACPIDCCSVDDDGLVISDGCLWCGLCVGACEQGVVDDAELGMKVYMGGRWGKRVRIGRRIDHFFESEDEVCDFIENVLLYYKENGRSGERLESTLERLGFEDAEKRMLAGEFLARKDEILGK